MDSRRTIAFVVAHPDDVAFSFGGTAWLLHEQYKIHVLCASKGERGYTWKGQGMTPPSMEVGAQRAGEEAEACKLLGAELTFLGQMDGEIFAGAEVCRKVAGMLEAIKPAAVFTHGPLEKPDHSATYGIALHSLQLANLFWTTELYMVAEYGADYHPRMPDVCVNISAVIEQKRELIRCHRHHIKSEQDVDVWVESNRMLGRYALCDWAEGYHSSMPMIGVRWKRRAGSILMDLQPGGPAPASTRGASPTA